MNDTSFRPEDPSLFTMRLNVDGTVSMRPDCNRGSVTWFSEPSADGMSGRFEFGPMAATRAFCPPPNLDDRFWHKPNPSVDAWEDTKQGFTKAYEDLHKAYNDAVKKFK